VPSMNMNSNSAVGVGVGVGVGYLSPSEVEHAKAELRNQLNLKHNQEVNELKYYYEQKLAQQETIQETQIDEVLDQLTSIESAYCDKLAKKDIMTEALTNSLTSYQIKNDEIKQQHEISLTRLDEAKQDIEAGHERYEALKEQCLIEKKEAVKGAQNEIRLAAESQFASAQKTYMKLQKDYRHSCNETSLLTLQCEEMTRKVDQLEQKERENDKDMSKLMSEVAFAKAAMATIRAEMQKMKQGYNEKIQEYVKKDKASSAKLAQTEKDCKDAQKFIDEACKEKEAARKENLELQTLCEELMGIVEGNSK